MLFGESVFTKDAFTLMDCAFDNGVTYFDCSEMYPFPVSAETQGQSEVILGQWLKTKPRYFFQLVKVRMS